MARRLPAEWEATAGIMMAWPLQREIWEPEVALEDVQRVHLELMREISARTHALVVCADPEAPRQAALAAGLSLTRMRFVEAPTNDIWIRDFGPITVQRYDLPLLLDFGYNGWGLKYPADLDNLVTRHLHLSGVFGSCQRMTMPIVLEGGSIDSDGDGCLLTTAACLLSPNRNPHLDEDALTVACREYFGVDQVIWLREGWLDGDDTDAHIDMLARFAPGQIILHTTCDDPDDEHAGPLGRLADELRALRRFKLLPLPIPAPMHGDDGRRLPASYANFLVVPDAVLVPTYADPRTDVIALTTIAEAFPGYDIVGIDCRPLIHQHGSLHCATMQLPAGALPACT